ncbi:alpha/beta fold hydrolase [Mycolicibacterium komossense]|nr:alpha/beta hydrolase [Mycolicibacterium komossense]
MTLGMPSRTSAPPPGSRSRNVVGDIQHGLVPVDTDVRLHYVVAGQGDPVVLLPGWPQSWYTWRFVMPQLINAGRRVYAIDPRGFGDSDIPPTGYDLETGARDLHRFLEQLGLACVGGVDIVSHDIGSWIAHTHAVIYPDDVRRLVLSDAYIPGVSPSPPPGYPDTQLNARQWHFYFNRVEGLPEALIHGREAIFLAWFFGPQKLARTWAIEPDAFDEYLRVFSRPGAVRAGLSYYREAFSPNALDEAKARGSHQLSMPILTLGGEYADADNLYHTVRAICSDVTNEVFDGVGHHITEECPHEFSQAVLQFWRNHPTTA